MYFDAEDFDMRNKNKIWDVDLRLFASLEGHYISPEESNFFQNMQFKQEYEPALANDLIMSETDNQDGIYIVREFYDEYVVGVNNQEDLEKHVMNLSEALEIKLKEVGLSDSSQTLFEWLRARNYQGISYNRNYDLI
jgi:hypothetical protein